MTRATLAHKNNLIIAALLLSLNACATRTLQPVIVIDAAFPLPERAEIRAGLHEWEEAVPEISFQNEVTLEHAAIIGEALARERLNSRVYIVRVLSVSDRDCPNDIRGIPADHAVGNAYGHSVICLVGPALNLRNEWRKVVAHEMGHILGLSHLEAPSVMTPTTLTNAEAPTPGDVKALRALWGI
jgi:hypothetical protein